MNCRHGNHRPDDHAGLSRIRSGWPITRTSCHGWLASSWTPALFDSVRTTPINMIDRHHGHRTGPRPRAGVLQLVRHQADADLQIVDAGRGDVPLIELRFRRLQCGTDRTDFVVTSRDKMTFSLRVSRNEPPSNSVLFSLSEPLKLKLSERATP